MVDLIDPAEETSCARVIERADQIYVDLFQVLDYPTCGADADCVVVDAHLSCAGFEHRRSPFAVHVSERGVAAAALEERRAFCDRDGPACRLERSCYEDVPSLRAVCSAGRCALAPQGVCIDG